MAVTSIPHEKGLFIIIAVVLAPVLLVGVVALAAGDWRQVGATPGGDQVLVSSVTAKKNGLRSAWVRVEYKEPTKLPQGGPFVELRARVRFNCRATARCRALLRTPNGFTPATMAANSWSARRLTDDDQFGQAAEGDFGEIARDFVCKQK